MTTTAELFTFNGNYKDLAQVEPYLPAFLEVYAELDRGRGVVYNDAFRGTIPAIANTEQRGPNTGTHEDTAIYLLQTLKRQREQDARIAELIAEGYEHIEEVTAGERFARVVLYTDHTNGSRWSTYHDARLYPETDPVQAEATGKVRKLLPKGRRTNGVYLSGERVLALRKVIA